MFAIDDFTFTVNNYCIIPVEEVVNFSQVDLVPEDVMLLDTWDTIFLWIGQYANREEKKQSIMLAFNYLRTGKFHLIGPPLYIICILGEYKDMYI